MKMNLCFCAALALALAGCGGGSDSQEAATRTVKYSVVAGLETAAVTLQVPGGGVSQFTAPVSLAVWTQTYTCHAGDFLYVSAQTNNGSSTASVSVYIDVNGETKGTNTSRGAFAVVSTQASC